MSGLQSFSDWVLQALPRLFLYPGGLWLLALLVPLLLVRATRRAAGRTSLTALLLDAPLAPVALAWVALALSPLPGASPLPVPLEPFLPSALLLASLALEPGVRRHTEIWTVLGITMALLAPLAAPDAQGWGVPGAFSLVAVLVGLVTLAGYAGEGAGSAARWLAWLGLALAPPLVLMGEQAPLVAIALSSVAALLAVVLLPFISSRLGRRASSPAAASVVWALASFALLASLLTA